MTPEQVVLVKNSWALVMPIAEHAAKLLYDKVFELEPPQQSLFTGDMVEQGKQLFNMIDIAVNSLDRVGAIVPAVERQGERLAEYGVRDRHYEILGEALLGTLGKILGDEFTQEVKQAWTITYHELTGAVKTATVMAA